VILVFGVLTLASFGFFQSFEIIFGEFEKDAILTKMHLFKESNLLKRKAGRFILYDRNIEYDKMSRIEKVKLDWLKIDEKMCEEDGSGGGILRLNGEGFPSNSGSFVLKGNSRSWKITFTPVVGKINVYRLK